MKSKFPQLGHLPGCLQSAPAHRHKPTYLPKASFANNLQEVKVCWLGTVEQERSKLMFLGEKTCNSNASVGAVVLLGIRSFCERD